MIHSKETRKTVKGHFVVRNDRGLHTRPCAEIVKCCSQFRADIRLRQNKSYVNAKSILGIMMLAASCGSKVYIEAEGEDADVAVSALIDLATAKFNILY